jgi:golgi phosphoprotein 3
MKTPETLFLHEEILLLALRDKEGTFTPGSWHAHALAGAVLAELLLAERIRLNPTGRRPRVEAAGSKPLEDHLLNEALERIRVARRPVSLASWVERFANWGDLPHRIAGGLCGRGILRADERKVLLLFRQRVYPEVEPEPERRLIGRLAGALSGSGADPGPRIRALLAIAHPTGLLRNAFERRFLKDQRGFLEMVLEGEPIGRAVRESIQAADTAAVAACAVVAAT